MKSLLKTEREMLQQWRESLPVKELIMQATMPQVHYQTTECLQQLEHSICQLETLLDVLSMAQVAEGALDEHSAALQRIRELSIQAATDILNSEQRVYLQTEVNQLLDEMDRVSRDTTFNEIAVLDGTFADRRFQIGSHEREKAVISVANLRIQNLVPIRRETDVHIRFCKQFNAEGTAAKSGINSLIDADDDFTITGLLVHRQSISADNNTAKDIVN